MTMELTNQNGAHPGGLGAYRQLSTIESTTAPPRNPAKQTLEFAYPSYGAEQIQAIEFANSKPVFGGARTNFFSLKRHAAGRSGSPKSIAEQLGSAQAMVDKLRKVADKAKRVSRHDLEKKWLAAHRHEFRGRWIALDGDQLLAAGTSSKGVFAAVGKHKPTPLVMQIAEQESSFPGW